MPRIVKGDTVLVVSGDDRGKTGRVLAVFQDKHRVLIEGVNFVKRHTRPSQQNPQGGIVEREAPIHLSNVMLYDPKAQRGTRVRSRVLSDGTRVRESVTSGEVLEKPKR
ncbi:MAG: 50S ribosomal protein L24 [Gemmatimonadota bacterium]